jgi:hypothetical protein
MENLLGASVSVFIGVTLVLFGGAAWLTGQALAGTWRPDWQAFLYAPLLAALDRFFIYALFEGELLSLPAYLLHAMVLLAATLLAYRLTKARKMVSQYPWLYERAGPFGWRRSRGPDGTPQDGSPQDGTPRESAAEEELPS